MKYWCCSLLLLGSLLIKAQQVTVIRTNSAKDLIPEGIVVDDRTGDIYVSSINHHSIIAFGLDGQIRSFVTPGQDGFLEGLGMKIDKATNRLWALSNKKDSNHYTSRIHAFDLATGKTVFQYAQSDTVPHLFNDLVIAADGTLYFTDTYFSAVYRLKPNTKAPEVFIKSPSLNYPNGLAFGKGSRLFIATYENGLMQLDVTTKTLKPLPGAKDTVLSYGLDGLVFQNNTLIGVYNNSDNRSTNAVVQYQLSPQGDRIIGEKILDKGHPAYHEPTTAGLASNKLYVLANSHLARYNANQQSTNGIANELTPVTVVVYALQ